MGGVVLGDHHHPRRAAVEAVHDAGALLAADAAEPRDVVQQGVHQRPPVVTGRGVDDHAGRLVDDHEVGVVVQHGQRQRLRRRRRRGGGGYCHVDHVAGVHRVARPDRPLIEQHVAFPDQPLDPRPRQLGHDGGDEMVEARAVVVAGDLQALRLGGGHRRRGLGAGGRTASRAWTGESDGGPKKAAARWGMTGEHASAGLPSPAPPGPPPPPRAARVGRA